MRKVVYFMHVSLDGFVAGPNGEMDWVILNDEMFDFVGQRTDQSDSALYGRKTWEMMDGYWPTAGDSPNASKHAKVHSAWYNKIDKFVLSHTMKADPSKKVHVIGKDIAKEMNEIKTRPGKEILIFGSPTAAHSLMQLDLIDEFWMFVNPILGGKGIPMFEGIKDKVKLKFITSHVFDNGVVCMSYSKV